METIVVMSFNLKRNLLPFGPHAWHRRAGQAARLIREVSPDILGTQELTEGPLGDMERLLPEYQWVGEGRGGGHKGEYTAIFFRKDKFHLMSQQTFWLSPTPDRPSRDWTTPFPRICTCCELQPLDSPEKPIRVYNTHLDHLSYFARVRGLREILRRIAARYAEAPGPVILMGDFNATPTSRTLRRWIAADLTKSAGLMRDCYWGILQQGGEIGRSYHGFRGRVNGAPIDYIFTSRDMVLRQVQLQRERLEEGFPSDHYPVVAQVEL